MRNGDGDGDRAVIGKADDRMVEHQDAHIGAMERTILACLLDGRQRQVGKTADQAAPYGDDLVKYPVAETRIEHLQRGRRHVHLNIAALIDADGFGNNTRRCQKCSIRHQLCCGISRPEAVIEIKADRPQQGQQHPTEQLHPQALAEPSDRRAHLGDEATGHI